MKLSVVIPVYNGERTLERALQAVLAVRCPPHELEVVVVDDGSTDQSAALAARYPVKVIRQSNGGPAKARNAGWRSSSGEIVLFTDSDCIPEPAWASCLIAGFSSGEVGAVGGSYEIANPESPLARFIHAEIIYRHRRMPDYVKAVGTYNLAVRRRVLEELGGFDESYPRASGEDNDLSYRIQKRRYRIAFRAGCRVAHHHPEKWRPYLRTQFTHACWRTRLYRSHPEFMAGDDYTRFRDVADLLLATLTISSPVFFLLSLPAGFAALALSMAALTVLQGRAAATVLRESREWRWWPAATGLLILRAFWRLAGLVRGISGNRRQGEGL